MVILPLFLLFISGFYFANGLENGLAVTPPMGWNPYNAFLCDTTEDQYHIAGQTLIDLGLNNLGYNYLNIDCGWQGTVRDANGQFTWDEEKLPSGPAALGDFVHSLGLKYGLYSDGGYFACDSVGGTAHYLGSLNHEADDALTFASWGADYLKYDNCYAVSSTDFVDPDPPIEIKPHYEAMRDALIQSGRPILFSACEWGVQDPARWPGSDVANSWRIANDIGPPASWDNIFRIINQAVPITQFSGPGGWNDFDLLEVGNPELTIAEQQTNFAFWAAVKSPLIISTDLTNISATSLAILQNTRIIAINQDSLGKSVRFKRRYTDDHDVWSGSLADGSMVVVVINLQESSAPITFNLADVGFSSGEGVDLITGNPTGVLTGSYNATLQSHGCMILKISNGVAESAPSFTYYDATSPSNILAGGATTRQVSSAVSVVGYIGNGGTLTMTGINGGSSGGTILLSIDYINGDYVFSNTDCSNCRNAYFSVNGNTSVKVQMPISAQSWDIVYAGYLVALDGFRAGMNNTIEISNPDAWTPDFYRIGVAV